MKILKLRISGSRGWLTVSVAAALTVALAACSSSSNTSSSPGGSKGPITLGASIVLSGANAYVGQNILNGLKLGIAKVNADGGVLGGRQLKLTTVDDGCDPGTAVTAVKKLISDSVPAIFAPGCSGAALAQMAQIKASQIPFLVSDASNAQITADAGVGGNKYTWRINADDSVIADGFSKYIAKNTGTIAAIAEDDDFGRGGVSVYQKSLPANNVQMVSAQYYTPGLADFRPLLAKIQSEHPAGLLLIMEPKDAATLIRQIKQVGLTAKIYGRGFISPEFTTALGDASLANGIVGADFWAVGMDPSFDAAYKAAYKTEPPPDSAGPYNAALVMAKAIDLGGGATSAAIQKGMSQLDIKVGWGPVKFDDHDQAHPNVVLEEIVGGTVKILSSTPS
ncbi:MAG: branched-chain amino acid transport system substrate-binding protein [Pseudonocardiales bacterium]|nr:branched-chain amino acid transport system substrate-binding protein [Pseudonocardiales bacterium]